MREKIQLVNTRVELILQNFFDNRSSTLVKHFENFTTATSSKQIGVSGTDINPASINLNFKKVSRYFAFSKGRCEKIHRSGNAQEGSSYLTWGFFKQHALLKSMRMFLDIQKVQLVNSRFDEYQGWTNHRTPSTPSTSFYMLIKQIQPIISEILVYQEGSPIFCGTGMLECQFQRLSRFLHYQL